VRISPDCGDFSPLFSFDVPEFLAPNLPDAGALLWTGTLERSGLPPLFFHP